MKPGELQSGGYGFYYKGYNTAPVAEKDVLAELQTVITPVRQPQRPTVPAIPYKETITSDVYFSNEKWQEVLASHGILVDAEKKTSPYSPRHWKRTCSTTSPMKNWRC